jgi:LPXTG-motif cell wall-anchored protein
MVSYLTTFLFIGQFLPPIIFNPIFSAFSFNGVFLIAGMVCAILTALFLISWRKKRIISLFKIVVDTTFNKSECALLLVVYVTSIK